jgi:hypothetical protein
MTTTEVQDATDAAAAAKHAVAGAEADLVSGKAIGAEVDKLAEPEHTEQLAEAVRDIAAACARFHTVAGAHDADLADLIAAATDLRAEPAAPGGPRETSSFIAVKGDTITHRRIVTTPLAGHAQAALTHAMRGDIDRAVAEIRTATTAPERKRPDHLLRNLRSGMLVAITGELNDGMKAQLRTTNPRSGELEELSGHDVEKYMRGELG